MRRPFRQVDVFGAAPYRGNPVAVVLDGADLTDQQMLAVTRWANLSETTFVLPPSAPGADYHVRIFTPFGELPFAGHPTLGTCHAWLEAGGRPAGDDVIVQQCAAGLIPLRRAPERLAFAAPPLVRSGPAGAELTAELAELLGIPGDDVVAAEWVDNGPGWVAVLLADADAVLAVRPRPIDRLVGVVGPHPDGAPEAIEVRAFFPQDGMVVEDPVTGSLNASLAQWLLASGRLRAPYVARQGTAIGREGRIHVTADADGAVWIGGATVTCVVGELDA